MLLLLGQIRPQHNPKEIRKPRKWHGKKVSAARRLENEAHDGLIFACLLARFECISIDNGFMAVDVQRLARIAGISWKRATEALHRLIAAGKIEVRSNPYRWELRIVEGV